MRPIQFIDYDKLSDDVLYLGSKLYLRMNVSLSNKQDPDMRYHFHKEYSYDSKYSKTRLMSMKRSFDYYLSFDKTDLRNIVIIRPQDMIVLQRALAKVVLWFEDKERNAFYVRSKKLIVKKQQPILVEGLAMNGYIEFQPIVILSENDNKQTPGLRLTLGKEDCFADITIDKFYGLLYTINTIHIYEAAQNLLNYLGRPDFGTNLVEMEFVDVNKKEDTITGAKENRIIPNQKPKSFFDKVNEMMEE